MNVSELIKAFRNKKMESFYIFIDGSLVDSFYPNEIDILEAVYGELKVKSFEMDGDFKIHI